MIEKIGIIGLGYVGLPLALAFGNKLPTIGYDINSLRIQDLQKCSDVNSEISTEDINSAQYLEFTDNLLHLKDCNNYIITVQTPVTPEKKPDVTLLKNACHNVGSMLKTGDTVIFESTVFPGCTEEICIPILEAVSNLKLNLDFYCGYSPERISPGDTQRTLPDIKKVVSGSTPEVCEKIASLYRKIITAGVHKTKSIKIAEAAKIIENIQRDVNIALMNEFASIFEKLDVNNDEVLEAASTKWNFLNFKPGLVGGHCIGVDPYYLIWKSEQQGHTPELMKTARCINDYVPTEISIKCQRVLSKRGLSAGKAKILIMGFTFKENCTDVRNTLVAKVYHQLIEAGAKVHVHDPLADAVTVNKEYNIQLIERNELEKYDAIIVLVAHDNFKKMQRSEFTKIMKSDSFVMDFKNIFPKSYGFSNG